MGQYGMARAASGDSANDLLVLCADGAGDVAALVGAIVDRQVHAVHTDHLGSARLMTDQSAAPVWQWPYSAFGETQPTGVLQATPNPKAALTIEPVLLKATTPSQVKELHLRFPGQYADEEAGNFYNYFRSYDSKTGRYTQNDPIGLDGGLNRFGYVDAYPLGMTDPLGLQAATAAGSAGGLGGLGGLGGAAGGSRGGYDPRTDTFTPIPHISIPSFLKPDECPPENNCDKLNDDVQRPKDKVGKFQPAACSAGMSKLDLLARSSAWLELAVARAKRDQKCWAGGDAGHQQAQADAWANLGRRQRLLR
jgi:RHS repeat-associated protein